MGRLLRVSVHGIDGSWIDLTPESFGTGGAIPLSLRVPIPKDKRDEINWDEFSFKLERTFTSFDDGMDLDFFFDNVALVSDVAPYVYMDGTSMAAPVVTGSCALLAGLFPNDGAEQLRARILGEGRALGRDAPTGSWASRAARTRWWTRWARGRRRSGDLRGAGSAARPRHAEASR
ncbi:MAG: S8 family serine peptidase [Eggerthella lenta]